MSRNPKIEAILEAWYNWERSPHADRFKAKAELDGLLRETIGKNPFTPDQVLDELYDQYLEFKKSRRAAEKVQIARSARSK